MNSDRLLVIAAILSLFSVVGTVVVANGQTKQIVLYEIRPVCDHPVALMLSPAWVTPFESGLQVWVCK